MRITKTHKLFKEYETIFRCPLCNSQMAFKNENSLSCQNRHCFDLSKRGYINFIPNHCRSKYTKQMFECRQLIFQSGFYNPLKENIDYLINKYFCQNPSVLDVGCGEGFFVSGLTSGNIFAMDIFKDAIILAAKKPDNIKWIIGDLSNIPIMSGAIDVLLNIFAPANYSEFSRVMSNDGIIIKVIPGAQYLQELREIIKKQLINIEYSNEQILEGFCKNMICLDKKHLIYQLPVNSAQLEAFAAMTPMMFNIDTEKIVLNGIKQITFDIEILIGKPIRT